MYNFIDPSLFIIADLAKLRIEGRYALRNCKVESSFDSSIRLLPTFHWKTPTHIIVCEVSNRPFPIHMNGIFAEISVKGLSVKLMVIYPANNTLNTREFQEDVSKAKLFGIGLISVDEITSAVNIEYEGLSIQLHQPKTDLYRYVKKLRPHIEGAITTYSNGDAKHGVQELGQIIESLVRNVAIEAKKRGAYNSGGNPSSDRYAFGNIVDDLIRESIIDRAFLGRCRGYVDDRNRVSHKPRTLKKAIELENKLRLDFQTGLRILEELPVKFAEKTYKLKI